MLFMPCIFLYLLHQPTNALSKIQVMTIINLLHVSVPGCHPQGVFRSKEYKPNTLIWVCIFLIGMITPYPANVENMVSLLIMPADGRWDLVRHLKG